jgi:hypothetical protein
MKSILMYVSISLMLIAGIVQPAVAQVGPPTLTAGIGQLAFKKGELDTDLILSLVATKQSEAKEELAQRLILDKLECGSFAVYDFVKKSLNILFSDADPNVKKKELLKNAAQLAMVIGIAEAYLREVRTNKENSGERERFKIAYDSWFYGFQFLDSGDVNNYISLSSALARANSKYSQYSINKENNPDTLQTLLANKNRLEIEEKRVANSSANPFTETNQYLPKIVALAQPVDGTLDYLERKKWWRPAEEWKCGSVSANHILIDLVYDLCLNNSQANRVGFFQDGISVSEFAYKNYFSKYWYFENGEPQSKKIFESFKGIREELDSVVNLSFTFFHTITTLGEHLDFASIGNLVKSTRDQKDMLQKEVSAWAKISEVPQLVHALKDSLYKATLQNIKKDDRAIIIDLLGVLEVNDKPEHRERCMYIIKEQLRPKLVALNMNGNGQLFNILKGLDLLYFMYQLKELEALGKMMVVKADSGKGTLIQLNRFGHFKELFSLLNQLDKVETYEVLLKFLVNVGEIYNWKTPKVILNKIMKVISQYVVIDKEQNTIQVNVESLGLALYDRFGDQQGRRLGMYFTVGSNYLTPRFKNDFVPESTQALKNVQLVSEKIGLEFKVVDWNRRRSYRGLGADRGSSAKIRDAWRRDRQPYFNNLHLLAYGSGLLYKLDFLNSEADFDAPLFGAGLGLTFFNGLDLNLSYGRVFNGEYKNDRDGDFFSLSFDIKFTEYLAALARKQKAKSAD